jgi:hypothetical protein
MLNLKGKERQPLAGVTPMRRSQLRMALERPSIFSCIPHFGGLALCDDQSSTLIHSVAIPVAVANKKGGAVTSFDNSDENRWDISNRLGVAGVTASSASSLKRG